MELSLQSSASLNSRCWTMLRPTNKGGIKGIVTHRNMDADTHKNIQNLPSIPFFQRIIVWELDRDLLRQTLSYTSIKEVGFRFLTWPLRSVYFFDLHPSCVHWYPPPHLNNRSCAMGRHPTFGLVHDTYVQVLGRVWTSKSCLWLLRMWILGWFLNRRLYSRVI